MTRRVYSLTASPAFTRSSASSSFFPSFFLFLYITTYRKIARGQRECPLAVINVTHSCIAAAAAAAAAAMQALRKWLIVMEEKMTNAVE